MGTTPQGRFSPALNGFTKVARASRALASDVGAGCVIFQTLLWAAVSGSDAGALASLPPGTVLLHIWLTILDGGWSRLRRASWLLLGLTWLGSVTIGFIGFLLPWGPAGGWLAGELIRVPLVGETLVEWMSGVETLGHAVPWPAWLPVLVGAACFVADVAVAAVIRFRRRWARGLVSVALGAVTLFLLVLALVLAIGPPVTQPIVDSPFLTPLNLVPPTWMLAAYSVLRSVPQKSLGLVLVVLATLAPLSMPLIRAERFRSGLAGVVWPMLCLALLAVWIALGWLGLMPPEEDTLLPTRLLAGCYFAFFVIAAPLAGRFLPKPAGVPGHANPGTV